jgi:hypothetical protein
VIEEFVAMAPHEYIAVALWILHSHDYLFFEHTPRLVLRSPVGNCGKTTLLKVLQMLAARAKRFDNVTSASLIRKLDETHLTALLDEAHNLGVELRGNGLMRAVFNSGHAYGGTVSHMEGHEAREFSTFAPLALALPLSFGALPQELNSRSITIQMKRNAGQRPLKRFVSKPRDPVLDAAYQQILLRRRDTTLNPDPEMPEGLGVDRLADNWRPLLSIADAFGWGERARDAMVIFARDQWDLDIRAALLRDVRRVFDKLAKDRLSTKRLLDELYELEGADWSHYCGLEGSRLPHKLTEGELAQLLKPFKIRSRSLWPTGPRTTASRSFKGYVRCDFEEVWRAYCDNGTASQSSNIRALGVAGGGTR